PAYHAVLATLLLLSLAGGVVAVGFCSAAPLIGAFSPSSSLSAACTLVAEMPPAGTLAMAEASEPAPPVAAAIAASTYCREVACCAVGVTPGSVSGPVMVSPALATLPFNCDCRNSSALW